MSFGLEQLERNPNFTSFVSFSCSQLVFKRNFTTIRSKTNFLRFKLNYLITKIYLYSSLNMSKDVNNADNGKKA